MEKEQKPQTSLGASSSEVRDPTGWANLEIIKVLEYSSSPTRRVDVVLRWYAGKCKSHASMCLIHQVLQRVQRVTDVMVSVHDFESQSQ